LANSQEVASLYGSQPPADAGYVRVVNASSVKAKVLLQGGGTTKPSTLDAGTATRYDVLKPADKIQLTVDGKALGAGISINAGETITLGVTHGASGWQVRRIVEQTTHNDRLKVALQVFNLASNCKATVAIAEGATVFSQVGSGEMKSRSINPVVAKLVGSCEEAAQKTSAPLTLPRLSAGDSYSLFLSGESSHPVLFGMRDVIAWPANNR
jgi:hypothetical protein